MQNHTTINENYLRQMAIIKDALWLLSEEYGDRTVIDGITDHLIDLHNRGSHNMPPDSIAVSFVQWLENAEKYYTFKRKELPTPF